MTSLSLSLSLSLDEKGQVAVWQQAENRLHVPEALLSLLLA
jgi:ornithine carbamoyltransferase